MKVHLADRDGHVDQDGRLEFVDLSKQADAFGVVEIPDDTSSFLEMLSGEPRFEILPPLLKMNEEEKRAYRHKAHDTLYTLYFQSDYD